MKNPSPTGMAVMQNGALNLAFVANALRFYANHIEGHPQRGDYFPADLRLAAEMLVAGTPPPQTHVIGFETNKSMLTSFGAADIREGSRMCFGSGGEEDEWEGYYEVPFHVLDGIREALSRPPSTHSVWDETAPTREYVDTLKQEIERLRAIALDMQSGYVKATERAEEAVKAANALQDEVDRLRAALANVEPVEIPGELEMFEGKLTKVVDASRTGWWRFHAHRDRDGYCDNPARGY